MSHEINERDDVMLERTAWHRLGTVVGAQFGWHDAIADNQPITLPVFKVPVRELIFGVAPDGSAPLEGQADEYAAVRADGLVIATGLGEQWTPFLASDGYDFGQAVRDEASDEVHANLLSLGTLYNGRVWFMTFALGDFDIVGYQVKDYFTISGSYDSSRPLQGITSPTLVVCGNTLAAHDFGMRHYKFKHTSGIFDRVAEAKAALKQHRANRGKLQEKAELLAATPLTPSAYSTLLTTLLPTDGEDVATRTKNVNTKARELVTQLYKGAPVNGVSTVTDGGRDGFTFVQAVNTYEQHFAPIRKTKGQDEATTRALRQFDATADGAQPLTDKAMKLVLS